MKWLYFVFFAGAALAQDITFTNKTATFTNLEGRVYTNVTLVKANLDGIVWRGDGAGLVSYTNLSPALLESLGIPAQRIVQAKARAAQKAKSDAQLRAAGDAAARKQAIKNQQEQAALLEARAAEEKDAPRKAALEEIQNLEARIKAEDSSLRHAEAAASDYNSNPNNGGYSYVQNAATRREAINDARDRLREMKADYARKYFK